MTGCGRKLGKLSNSVKLEWMMGEKGMVLVGNRKHEEDIDKVRERAAKARLEHHQRVKEMYERKISRKE